MNCNNCGRIIYTNQTKCHCGERIYHPPTSAIPRGYASNASSIIARKFAEKLHHVNSYVAHYRSAHLGSTKREACLVYLREHGLMGALPESVKHEAGEEARAEREAIQNE